MYSKEDLRRYAFFDDKNIEYIIDPLTGVLTRACFQEFVESLIKDNTVFSLCMLDMDNFKLVNDNYGHKVGDECLVYFANGLQKYLGKNGLIGRFGGDEFVFILFSDGTYDGSYNMLSDVYKNSNVLRNTYHLSKVHLLVTSTCGCASFPKDGKSYDELFQKVDKALYRGKIKGRNCFIVYVHELHKDIDVKMKENRTLYSKFYGLDKVFSLDLSYEEHMKFMCDYIVKTLDVSDCLIILDDNREFSFLNDCRELSDTDIKEINKIFKNDSLVNPSNLKIYKDTSNYFRDSLGDSRVQAICGTKVCVGNNKFIYMFIHDDRIRRIWQENEMSMLMYAGKVCAMLVLMKKI